MSFSITLFGPSHRWWKWDKNRASWEEGYPKRHRYWFYRPDEHSSGGVGFCIPGLHVVFCWGRK